MSDSVPTSAFQPSRGLRLASMILAGAYGVALLACGITDLALNGGFTWTWLVLTALATAASLTILPVWLRRHRAALCLLAFFLTLNLLVFTAAWFSGGTWYPVVAASLLLGFSLAGLPLLLRTLRATRSWTHKGLAWMAFNSLLVFGLLWVVADFAGLQALWLPVMCPVAAFGLALPWAIFLEARYLPWHPLGRTGLALLLAAGYTWLSVLVIPALTGDLTDRFLASDITAWVLGLAGLVLLTIRAFQKAGRRAS